MNITEMLALLEQNQKEKHPAYAKDIGLLYASMYGMLSAYITEEQLLTILRHRGIELDNQTETL